MLRGLSRGVLCKLIEHHLTPIPPTGFPALLLKEGGIPGTSEDFCNIPVPAESGELEEIKCGMWPATRCLQLSNRAPGVWEQLYLRGSGSSWGSHWVTDCHSAVPNHPIIAFRNKLVPRASHVPHLPNIWQGKKKNPIFSFFTNYVFPKYFFFLPAVSLCILSPLPSLQEQEFSC